MQRTQGLLAAALVAGVSFAITACGSSGQTAATSSTSATAPATATSSAPEEAATSSAASTGVPAPVATFNLSGKATDGSTESATLTVYPVERALSPAYGAWPPLSDACQVDSERDAIVPADILLTNTTSGFAADLTYELKQQAPQNGTLLLSDATYSSGPICGNGTDASGDQLDAFGFGSSGQTAPGASIEEKFYFIVPSYYTPSSPSGDASVLHQFVLDAEPGNSSVAYDVTSFTGPGVNAAYHWFRLDGTAAGSP